jgi:hypothetical protein
MAVDSNRQVRVFEASVGVTYDAVGGGVATVDVIAGPTPAKVSAVAGWNESDFEFTVDGPVDEWELRAVSNGADPRDTNDPLVTSGGAVSTSSEETVTGGEMVAAGLSDGQHVLKVYALNATGWSD